jgi:hypothetical protein
MMTGLHMPRTDMPQTELHDAHAIADEMLRDAVADPILQSFEELMQSMGEPQGPRYAGAPAYSIIYRTT